MSFLVPELSGCSSKPQRNLLDYRALYLSSLGLRPTPELAGRSCPSVLAGTTCARGAAAQEAKSAQRPQ